MDTMIPDPQSITPNTQSPPADSQNGPLDALDRSSLQNDSAPDLPRRSPAEAEERLLTPALSSNEEERETHSSRRKGNVARLPKAIRDKINVMIEDGVPYAVIIKRLGDDGKGLCNSNLTHWKNGGHQDWLLEQNWLAETRAKQESASDVSRDYDATQVNHAALQLGALHMYEALRKLGPGTLDEKLGGNAAAFARLIHALARASRETLQLQKYRESCAKARAALQNLRDPKHKLTEDERRSLVLMVDDIMGLPPQGVQCPMSKVQSQETAEQMTNDQ